MTEDVRFAMRELLRAALALIAVRTAGGFPTYPVARIDFSERNTLTEGWYDVPAAGAVIHQLTAELNRLAEMPAAAERLSAEPTLALPATSDAAGRPAAPTEAMRRSLITEQLRAFVRDYIETHETLEFSDELFEQSFEVYRALWHSREVLRELIAPLPGLTSEVETIEFAPDMKLLSLPPELKTALCSTSPFGTSLMTASEFAQSQFRLSAIYGSRSPLHSDGRSLANIERAILALRLVKAGDVGIRAYFDRIHVRPLRREHTAASSVEGWRGREYGRRAYELTRPDVAQVQSVYQQLNRLESARRLQDLETALRRFQLTYTRLADEDRLIDLTIALECTLLYGIRDELSYRLAMRGAVLLAAERDPEDTHRFLKAMYEARSKVVHDGSHVREIAKNNQIAGRAYDTVVEELENIVRATLRELLLRLERTQFPLRKIVDALDIELVRSLAR